MKPHKLSKLKQCDSYIAKMKDKEVQAAVVKLLWWNMFADSKMPPEYKDRWRKWMNDTFLSNTYDYMPQIVKHCKAMGIPKDVMTKVTRRSKG